MLESAMLGMYAYYTDELGWFRPLPGSAYFGFESFVLA